MPGRGVERLEGGGEGGTKGRKGVGREGRKERGDEVGDELIHRRTEDEMVVGGRCRQ